MLPLHSFTLYILTWRILCLTLYLHYCVIYYKCHSHVYTQSRAFILAAQVSFNELSKHLKNIANTGVIWGKLTKIQNITLILLIYNCLQKNLCPQNILPGVLEDSGVIFSAFLHKAHFILSFVQRKHTCK